MKRILYFLCCVILFLVFGGKLSAQCYNQTFTVTDTIVRPCNHDGKLNIQVTGGIAPYTFRWYRGYGGGPIIDSVQNLTNISGGMFAVVITDSTGTCGTYYFTVPQPFYLSITSTPDYCPAHNGTATATVSGGSIPYTYLWSDGSTLPTDSHLRAGLIDLTVTDGAGCKIFARDLDSSYGLNIYSQDSLTPNITPTNATCTPNSGRATVATITGSRAAPFKYLWSNGDTTQTITNLAANYYYSVTVTDSSGCFGYAYTQIALVSPITITTSSTNEVCNRGNGTASAIAAGTTGPYTYYWSDSATTPTTSGLTSTDYWVTVTDSHGCENSQAIWVGRSYPFSLSFTSTPELCISHNGTATVVATGTTSPLTYHWSDSALTQTATGLIFGTYYVSVQDTSGCVVTGNTYVSQSSPIIANPSSTGNTCPAATAGSAAVSPTLGTAPYSFLWSNGAITQTLINLTSGYYWVTITDHVGCTVTSYVTVVSSSPIVPHATYTSENCPGGLGSATLNPTGGVTPYTFAWNTGQTTNALTGLAAGYYYYTITDVNGCSVSNYINVPYNSGLYNGNVNGTGEVCLERNGTESITIAGGLTPYHYLWSNGDTTQTIDSLRAGYYYVTVTDQNGCSAVKSGQIHRTSPLSATISVTPASCIFNNDGAASVTVSYGTSPYTYQWGNGSTLATASSLDANWGIGVFVTDANGCTVDATVNSVGYHDLTCAAVIKGKIVDDLNVNCTFDFGDGLVRGAAVSCIPGGYTQLTNSTGNYQFIVPPGNYAVTQNAPYRNQGCPVGSYTLNNCIAGIVYGDSDFYDWPLNVQDMRVSFDYVNLPRPGFNHTITVCYYNDGLNTVPTGSVTFVYDTGAVYVSGGSSDNAATHTVTINFSNLAPGDYACYSLIFHTPATTPLGTLQSYSATVIPVVNDATPYNNVETAQYPVTGSYDPNLKAVTPKGIGASGLINPTDSILKYEIHFQNTGTFQAGIVAIRDTIDPSLDMTSIIRGASNHDYKMQILGTNILEFIFDPINLVDSSVSQQQSMGEVSFYIKLKKNLAGGTEIRNRASIYFDYNLPVQTNTTLNTLAPTTFIAKPAQPLDISLFPNPSSGKTNLVLNLTESFKGDITVTDMMGRQLVITSADLQAGQHILPLNVGQFNAGIYFVRVSNVNTDKSLKFVKE